MKTLPELTPSFLAEKNVSGWQRVHRLLSNYKENLFARTVEGNPLIDKRFCDMTVDGYVRFVPGCAVNACIVKPVCDFGAYFKT